MTGSFPASTLGISTSTMQTMSRVEQGFFYLYFCLLKKKPTQKETVCSYTKSVCFVHIAGLHSFNSSTVKSRDTELVHIPLTVGRKDGRSADCVQAFSNLPVLSLPSVSNGCFTIQNTSNWPSCIFLSQHLPDCCPDSQEKEDRTLSTLSPQGTL